jgi:hypothetical protein
METSGIKNSDCNKESALDEHLFTFFATCWLNIDKGKNGAVPAKFNLAAFFYKFKSPAKSRKDDDRSNAQKW